MHHLRVADYVTLIHSSGFSARNSQKVSFSVHSSLLRVNRPEQDSSGIYTCIVFHSLGRSQASICILISPDPDEDEEIEEIREKCSDGLDDPHPMDYRPIYRPSVLGTSNTTQRMVWNTKNFSGTPSPLSPNTTINGFLPTSTSTDSASGPPIKPRTISVVKSSPSPELNTEPAPVRDRDTKQGEDEQTGRGVQKTDEEAKARTDSPVKSTYLSWLPKMFRRKKAVVKNSNEQLASK
ncbi:unnamed protein product [Dibothriocephalus latus]|uniref:Ig-like domain-containing protein n=1 Tax=Dibothriocephalus latus TaxID=60516 RepID=A0A3P7KWI6_DIBLA|nr:unnamed protein product [Dibothriocephalus latus]